MLPFADVHVHLLAERDDGPRSDSEAMGMCRMLVQEGVGIATALAHQNAHFPENTPEALRVAANRLIEQLKVEQIPLQVAPSGEIILNSESHQEWLDGKLLSLFDSGKYLLTEMPWGLFLNPVPIALALREHGVRLVLAHAERYEEFLYDSEQTEAAIAAGCLIQVTTDALADPPSRRDELAMKMWAKRGMIHVLGSDGHRLDHRKPLWQTGYKRLQKWIGATAAERIGSIWGTAVLQGLPVNPPAPLPPPKSWFSKYFKSE